MQLTYKRPLRDAFYYTFIIIAEDKVDGINDQDEWSSESISKFQDAVELGEVDDAVLAALLNYSINILSKLDSKQCKSICIQHHFSLCQDIKAGAMIPHFAPAFHFA